MCSVVLTVAECPRHAKRKDLGGQFRPNGLVKHLCIFHIKDFLNNAVIGMLNAVYVRRWVNAGKT